MTRMNFSYTPLIGSFESFLAGPYLHGQSFAQDFSNIFPDLAFCLVVVCGSIVHLIGVLHANLRFLEDRIVTLGC